MKLSTEDIHRAIRLGEDSRFEFKEVRFAGDRLESPKRDQIAKELAAMANAAGGDLILGVKDKTREVLGIPVEQLDRVEDTLREVAQTAVTPAMSVDIYRHEISNDDQERKAVIVVQVERGLYVHATKEGYFRRTGSGAYPMDSLYLARLNQERSLVGLKRFEQLPVPGSRPESLSPALYQTFVSQQESDPRIALRKRNLLVENDQGEWVPSVAGILMAAETPQKWLPNTYIQAVRYRGIEQDSHYQVDARDLTGPLQKQVADAFSFFKLHNQTAATKKVAREEVAQFSERAVFEAIVNAVAHRDYLIEHSKIRFFVFDDRLEIYSPGSLINSMTIDSLAVRTATRNELLTNLLKECPLSSNDTPTLGRSHLMETRGDGIGIIQRETLRQSGQEARFELFDEAELRVTIPSAHLPNIEH